MYFLYSFLLASWIFVMLPFFAYKAVISKKYLPKLRERTGKLPASLLADGRMTIWFHSCSVGETLSVQPLAHSLHELYPEARMVFSVITQTGRKIADERFATYGAGNSFYFPIDEPPFVRRVLDQIKPRILICIDTEIWPNVIHECRKRGIPVVLANGRISAESFRTYRWVQPLLGPVLQNYSLLLMKSEEDAQRIRRMGAMPSRVRVTGNIKYDRGSVEQVVVEEQRRSIGDSFGLHLSDSPLIVAGSTHDREEETLFAVLSRLRGTPGLERTRLLIAPRHPERFDAVAALAQKMGHRVVRRSDGSPDMDASVLVLNTLGELSTAYSFATVAFVGGTLIPHGGQSIMEPSQHAKPIVIGPSMENFPKIIDEFIENGAVWRVSATVDSAELQREQLFEAFAALLPDADKRKEMGFSARSVFEGSQGATASTIGYIDQILCKVEC